MKDVAQERYELLGLVQYWSERANASEAEVARLTAERDQLQAVKIAAQSVIAQFEAIKAHQHRLLVEGQNLESASRNWDEATLGQSIDFQPLIDSLAGLSETRGNTAESATLSPLATRLRATAALEQQWATADPAKAEHYTELAKLLVWIEDQITPAEPT